jgi:hypothetical protein
MTIEAKILADSVSPIGKRITTFQICMPKCLLAEINTHRALSKNFSSARAIPIAKQVQLDSFIPIRWGKNQAGMEAQLDDISDDDQKKAEQIWMDAIEYCRAASSKLSELGLHKQWAGRLNDWHVMATGVVTATELDNFFLLRDHHSAQPEMQLLAQYMKVARYNSEPIQMKVGEWHLPYVTKDERNDSFFAGNEELLRQISAARCCRVSYNKPGGGMATIAEDIELCKRLFGSNPKHFSPAEHQAQCMSDAEAYFNLRGWSSYRYHLEQNFMKEV